MEVNTIVLSVYISSQTSRQSAQLALFRGQLTELQPILTQMLRVGMLQIGDAVEDEFHKSPDALLNGLRLKPREAIPHESQERVRRISPVPRPSRHHGAAIRVQRQVGQCAPFPCGQKTVALHPLPGLVVSGEVTGAIMR